MRDLRPSSGGRFMSVATILAALTVVAFATVVQRLTGMGFGIAAVPLLTLVAPEIGIMSVLILTVIVMVSVAWIERDALDIATLRLWSIVLVPGVVVGTLLAGALPPTMTHLAIGLLVVAGSTVSLAGWRIRQSTTSLALGATVAGLLTPLAALPGPPMALVYRPDDVRRMRSTLSAFFAVGSLISIATLLFTMPLAAASEEALRAATLSPAIALGAIVAIPLVRRLARRHVQRTTLVLSLLSGTALVVRATMDALA